MREPPIYLDYNATTPVDPTVLSAMLPYLQHPFPQMGSIALFGNPSSAHTYGREAHDAVEKARAQLADLLSASPDEIVFAGGGSEASNHAIKGTVFASLSGIVGRLFRREAHIITSAVEHPATLQPCDYLKRFGCAVTVLPVDGTGRVNPDDVPKAITRKTVLVTIMHSNNEVGTLQPIREIVAVARERGVMVHTDAAQSMGKLGVNVRELGVDLLTVAGHKLYAPKGIGALFVRQGVKLDSLIHGAGHENGRRAGTENVPYIVGLGVAAEVARQQLPSATDHLRSLRERLEGQLRQHLGDRIVLNGHRDLRLPNTLNVNISGCVGADLLAAVPGVAASTGSACHEGKVSQSPVLCAMGVNPELGRGAIRLSVGRFTTLEEIDRAADLIAEAARR